MAKIAIQQVMIQLSKVVTDYGEASVDTMSILSFDAADKLKKFIIDLVDDENIIVELQDHKSSGIYTDPELEKFIKETL